MLNASPDRKPAYLAGAALFLLVALSFFPALRGAYIWDDALWLSDNHTIRRPDGIWYVWRHPTGVNANLTGLATAPYPMVFTSYWVEYHLYKALFGEENALSPVGYHAVNLLIHACSALLLWRLLTRLNLRGAWLAAGLWAVHPMQVESVAWAAERKNMLAGLFLWASLLAYLRFHTALDQRRASPAESPPWRFAGLYLLTLACYLAALFSKTVTCVMPAVMLVILWWQHRLRWSALLFAAPMFALTLLFGAMSATHEVLAAGANGDDFVFTLPQRCAIAGRAFWFYLQKLFWPHPLLEIYPRFDVKHIVPTGLYFSAAAMALFVTLWLLRKKIGRGPLVAALCFLIILSPALGFINFYTMIMTFVADHYVYFACAAPLALVAELLVRWGHKRLSPNDRSPAARWLGVSTPVAAAAALLLGVLSLLSARQSIHYESNYALWSYAARWNPDNWAVQSHLGSATLVERRDFPTALATAKRAWSLRPEAETAILLADTFVALKELDQAEWWMRKTIELSPAQPFCNRRLAVFLTARGKHAEATPYFRVAAKMQPLNPDTHVELAQNLAAIGDKQHAKEEYLVAISLNPLHNAARYNLGNLYLDTGDLPRAIEQYQAIIDTDPTPDTYYNYALALHQLGRDPEARAMQQRAIQLEAALKPRK